MRHSVTGIAALLFATVITTASPVQGGFCGLASYNCCPQTACQPTSCYEACKVERRTRYRTAYRTVIEPQQYTTYRLQYAPEYEDVERTSYRIVNETQYQEQELSLIHI